jgi:kynureninase
VREAATPAYKAIALVVDRWPGSVFVGGGGYKYAQTGEGACWMLVPEDAERYRPIYTGWFADFENLESIAETVSYASGGMRFFGATFDPTALYRGVYVMRFMDEMGLTVAALRELSLAATSLIIDAYDRLALASTGLVLMTPREPERRGGFVTFRRDDAKLLSSRLADHGVRTDVRGPLLRVGPAPYLTSGEISSAMEILAEVARTP